ncbi:MAG: sodium:solute symporter, partial [Verrucomicrobiae bacterium]|nr:sodium:solute symporter [Verrucomicrobiae bacterium]
LLVAALFAAAMSTIDTSLNSSATITLRDIFRRIGAGDDEPAQMRVLRGSTVFWGAVGTGVAILLSYDSRNILKIWWDLSGVFAGAMLGLFLLGFIVKRATNAAAIIGVVAGLIAIAWMSFPKAEWIPEAIRFPLNGLMTTVIGTLAIFLFGWLAAAVFDRTGSSRRRNPV